ncbi:MAG: MarR family winged helix-turn-helix transcriptional regulator [Rubrivivax sp.]
MPAARTPARSPAPAVDIADQPGHLIRRLQQIAVAVFLQEVGDGALTPVQFAALQSVANQPGVDQRTLAGLVGLDTSTVAGVVDRLEARGWLARNLSPQDRRVRLLTLTPEGGRALAQAQPAMLRAQDRLLAPLPRADRREFMRLLRVLVDANNEHSRAPAEA